MKVALETISNAKENISKRFYLGLKMDKGLVIGQNKRKCRHWGRDLVQLGSSLLLPVGACMAELGMVAASWGTVLVSGSGVLVVGELGGGFSKVRGFLCQNGWVKVCYP